MKEFYTGNSYPYELVETGECVENGRRVAIDFIIEIEGEIYTLSVGSKEYINSLYTALSHKSRFEKVEDLPKVLEVNDLENIEEVIESITKRSKSELTEFLVLQNTYDTEE